jgi:TATA-binding protein-associated factor
MLMIISRALPFLGDTTNSVNRLGAAEVLSLLLRKLDVDVLPYLVFLLVPVLGRMSDVHEVVRVAVTSCFATMVKLMPLEVIFRILICFIYTD